MYINQGAGKSLARPGRKQVRKHVREERIFQQHRGASCHQAFSLQGKAPKEIHSILTETLICFLPGRAKDLSAPCMIIIIITRIIIISRHSSREHRALTKFRHLTRFLARSLISFHVLPCLISSRIVLRHVFRGLPRDLVP